MRCPSGSLSKFFSHYYNNSLDAPPPPGSSTSLAEVNKVLRSGFLGERGPFIEVKRTLTESIVVQRFSGRVVTSVTLHRDRTWTITAAEACLPNYR